MSQQKTVQLRRVRRRNRVRGKIRGTADRPRLSVFRSSKHIYAQLIDDDSGQTIVAASTAGKDGGYGGNVKAAKAIGQKLAEAAKAKGITKAAFDRGSYRFHGRVLNLAVAATEAGLVCCDPKNIKKPAPPAEKSEAKPAGKPKGEPKAKGGGKPDGQSPDKAAAKGGEKPEGQRPEKSAAKDGERPEGKGGKKPEQ
jgi:large subunit ribosomal protein L18